MPKLKEDTTEGKIKEAQDRVDLVFDNPLEYKNIKVIDEAEISVDTILDNMENDIDHVPDQLSGEDQGADVTDELSKDSLAKGVEELKRVPNPVMKKKIEMAKAKCAKVKDRKERTQCIQKYLMKEGVDIFLGEGNTEYQKFFQTQLKKWGVSSPSQLPPDKKKEFFNMIDKKWKGKKESD